MFRSTAFKSLSVASLLAVAIAVYVVYSPNEGLLSGPSTVSTLLHSLPIVNF